MTPARVLRSFLFIAITVSGWAGAAPAATLTVSDCSASSGAPGRLWEVILAAGLGDTVVFSCSGTITLADTLVIHKDLTLDGTGQSITISGGDDVRVFFVDLKLTTFKEPLIYPTH